MVIRLSSQFATPATEAVITRNSSLAVECRTLNRESLGSNPPFATVSKFGELCINEYVVTENLPVTDGGGDVSE